jgi:hypothetical protein
MTHHACGTSTAALLAHAGFRIQLNSTILQSLRVLKSKGFGGVEAQAPQASPAQPAVCPQAKAQPESCRQTSDQAQPVTD